MTWPQCRPPAYLFCLLMTIIYLCQVKIYHLWLWHQMNSLPPYMNGFAVINSHWMYSRHIMIFTQRNQKVNDISLYINNVSIKRVYVTKFLGVQIDSQLNWKNHIDYTCKKLCKCIGILSKARRKLQKTLNISHISWLSMMILSPSWRIILLLWNAFSSVIMVWLSSRKLAF